MSSQSPQNRVKLTTVYGPTRYSDVSCKSNKSQLMALSIQNYRSLTTPAWMYQSRHRDTAARAFYTCRDQRVNSCLSKVHCMFIHICYEITAKFVELCYLGWGEVLLLSVDWWSWQVWIKVPLYQWLVFSCETWAFQTVCSTSPIPPPMTDQEKNKAASKRLDNALLCHCGDAAWGSCALITFECGNKNEVSASFLSWSLFLHVRNY